MENSQFVPSEETADKPVQKLSMTKGGTASSGLCIREKVQCRKRPEHRRPARRHSSGGPQSLPRKGRKPNPGR